ncbi:MAG: FtsX-like permease family protein [Acidobacteria bacterium]|nr:FtsX-like permease family protein [Acidobacteriota bacterium]
MNFIFNLAYREIRASWHRLLFFFICIAIGVGSIVALRSLVQNLKTALVGDARSLMTADVQLSSNNPWSAETKAALDRIYASPMVAAHIDMLETATMARSGEDWLGTPKMVELKAVQPGFPFYGEMVLADGKPYSYDLMKDRGALVKQTLLTALGLKVGDTIKIGNLEFTIRGVIEQEPGNSMNAFSIGPRVMITYEDAVAAGLTAFGSRARHRVLFKTRDGDLDRLVNRLRNDLAEQSGITVRSFRFSQDRLTESLSQVEDYLSLIGLVILVLGGIGISSVTRVFVQQKMKTIAVLKTLGGRNARVLGAYLVQVLTLGLLGSLFGLLLAQTMAWVLPKYFEEILPPSVDIHLTWQAAVQGVIIGLLVSLLFSLLPLLQIRRIKPILVLRSADTISGKRFDGVQIAVGILVVAGLLAISSWQAGSFKIGGIFLIALALMTLVLNLTATGLMKLVRGFRHMPSFTVRQGINSLYRPGNQTRIILMAVGLGVFFVVGVRSLQLNLRYELGVDLENFKADMYLIDIQRDQRPAVEEAVAKFTGNKPEIIPTVRARIAAINGSAVNLDRPRSNENRRENRGMLGREYVLTYRAKLEDNEKIIAGNIWDPTPSSEPEISIEELMHDELGLNVGDTLTFDVLGRKITARVTSIRRVDWRNARTGFLVVFRPGTLDDAPTMYISAIKGPTDNTARAQLQRELVDKAPNISVVDIRDIIEIARAIVRKVSLAVSFVGGFVFLSGLLILIGSIAMTKFHRLYESAILKTLGAKKKLIVWTLLVEYGVLGLLAGLIGSVAAIGLTWAIAEKALKITWRFIPSVNVIGVATTLVLVVLVGVLSSWDVMIKKPLGILRNE